MHLQLKTIRAYIPFKPTEEIPTSYAHTDYNTYIDEKKKYALEQLIELPEVTKMLAVSTGMTFDELVQLIIDVYDKVKDSDRFTILYTQLNDVIDFVSMMGYDEIKSDSDEAFHTYTLLRYNSILCMFDFSLKNYIASLIHAFYIKLKFPTPETEPAKKVVIRRLKKKKM